MTRQRWFAITCEVREWRHGEERVVGFRQALLFSRREDAIVCFRENAYRGGWTRYEDGSHRIYRIRRVYL